jgi:hypothetical protein
LIASKLPIRVGDASRNLHAHGQAWRSPWPAVDRGRERGDDLTAHRRLYLVRDSAGGRDSGARLYRYLDMIRSKLAVADSAVTFTADRGTAGASSL